MPCKRLSPFIGALLGNLEGVLLPGLLREKEKYIWVPFLDPKAIKILSLRPSGTLVKEQGSTELISDYGAQMTRLWNLGASGPEGLEPSVNQSVGISTRLRAGIYFRIAAGETEVFRKAQTAFKTHSFSYSMGIVVHSKG